MLRRHLHNQIYLIPGILHMMTSLCFLIYCIRHFHSSTFIVFPSLALVSCILILPGAILSIVIGVFFCNAKKMHKLKKIHMVFAIITTSVHGIFLLGLAVLIFMETFDVETIILLVVFEFVLSVLSSIFLICFSPKKKDEEEESKYRQNRKNSFIITRPTVNEVPHMDQFPNSKKVTCRHIYPNEKINSGQSSPSIEELPDNQNSFYRDEYSTQSFYGKPQQMEKFANGQRFSRPGGRRVQNLRQCSVSIDEYPNTKEVSRYSRPSSITSQNSYTDQGIIDLGSSFHNGKQYPDTQEFRSNQDLYSMRCAHLIENSYSENAHCNQCYISGESTSTQQDYYMQEILNDTEEYASNADKQSDLYLSNTEHD